MQQKSSIAISFINFFLFSNTIQKTIRLLILLTFILSINPTFALAEINDGLVAYYPFNGNANDESGNGNDGTVNGATLTADMFSNDNSAYSFDGVDDYIEIPDNSSQQISTNQITLSAWINLNGNVGVTQWRVVNKQQTNGIAWGMEIFGNGYVGATGNNVEFHDSNGSTWVNCIVQEISLFPQTWYHITATDSGGTIKIYINGSLVHTCLNGLGIPSNINSPIVIGVSSNNFFYNGVIDNVRIYSRALSEEEVQQLYIEESTITWPVSAGGNDHSYIPVLEEGGIIWEDAYNAAVNAGGYLATITSAEENAFIYSLVSGNDSFWFLDSTNNGIGPWLGGFQKPYLVEPGGGWEWVTGEPFTYINWAYGQPDNSGFNGEDRLCFFGYQQLKSPNWGDYYQTSKTQGYIIEFGTPEIITSTTTVPSSTTTIAGSTTTTTIPPAMTNSKAIIVAGGGPYEGNNIWDATQMLANYAYAVLIYQGFTPDTIYYLTSDKLVDIFLDGINDWDADPTNENLEYAITEWAKDADDVIIYLVDHGGKGTFTMGEGEILNATSLDSWLDDLQGKIPGKVTFIYEACYSGSFVPLLKPPTGKERIVITSSMDNEQAIFMNDGMVTFSHYFWSNVFRGTTVFESFKLAKDAMETPGYQNAQLDDTGDGKYDKNDGTLSTNYKIGIGKSSADTIPIIGAIGEDQTISGTENSATIGVENVTSAAPIIMVWGIIREPGYNPEDTTVPVTDLPQMVLQKAENGQYRGRYDGFTKAGTYTISVYARDDKGNLSIPQNTSITKIFCPMILLSGGENEKTELLRRFRDEVLMKTPEGSELVNLFYKNSAELSSIIIKNPDLMAQCEGILKNILPAVKSHLLEKQNIFFHKRNTIEQILNAVSSKAAAKLKADIERIKKLVKKMEHSVDSNQIR